MKSSDDLAAPHLAFEFAPEACRPIAALLQHHGATLVTRLSDVFGDDQYWDFTVDGELLILHFGVVTGTSLYSARREGRVVLESLRATLDTDQHPILATRNWWPRQTAQPPHRTRPGAWSSMPGFMLRAAALLARGAIGAFGCFCVYSGISRAIDVTRAGGSGSVVRALVMALAGLAIAYGSLVRAPWEAPDGTPRRAA